MSDYRKDEIIYDEDWLTVDTPLEPQYAVPSDEQKEETNQTQTKKSKRKRTFPALITIQLVVCIIVAFSIFMLKAMNSDTYHQFCDWYNNLMRYTIVPDSTFRDIDLSQYMSASFDQLS